MPSTYVVSREEQLDDDRNAGDPSVLAGNRATTRSAARTARSSTSRCGACSRWWASGMSWAWTRGHRHGGARSGTRVTRGSSVSPRFWCSALVMARIRSGSVQPATADVVWLLSWAASRRVNARPAAPCSSLTTSERTCRSAVRTRSARRTSSTVRWRDRCDSSVALSRSGARPSLRAMRTMVGHMAWPSTASIPAEATVTSWADSPPRRSRSSAAARGDRQTLKEHTIRTSKVMVDPPAGEEVASRARSRGRR